MLATPEVQPTVTVPPLELVAIERPSKGEISVKIPPVELESVTATLVAFTVRASATEPVAMVKETAGEDK